MSDNLMLDVINDTKAIVLVEAGEDFSKLVEAYLPAETKPAKKAKAPRKVTRAMKEPAGMPKPEPIAVVSTEKLNEMLTEIANEESSLKIDLPADFKLAPERKDFFEVDALLSVFLGEDVDAARKDMFELRKQAYDLIERSKFAATSESIYKLERMAEEMSKKVFADVERRMFNTMKAENGDSAVTLQNKSILRDTFLKMQHSAKGSDARKQFDAIIMKTIEDLGLLEQHNACQEKALGYLEEIENKKNHQSELYNSAQDLFEKANEIARTYGWEVTGKKEDKNGKK